MGKNEIVEFYRHVFSRGEDSYYGLTFKFRIDYKNRNVAVGYAICNGDRFDKRIGRKVADETFEKRKYVFRLPRQGFGDMGILDYFLEQLWADNKNVPKKDIAKINYIMYLHSPL